MTVKAVPESVYSRLLKIKELSERGATTGERHAATKALTSLLEKHNLTMESLAKAETHDYEISFKNAEQKTLLFQIRGKVCGWNNNSTYKRRLGTRNTVWLELTPQQYIDITELFEYYCKALKEDLSRFHYAFICKHGLARPSSKEDADPEMDMGEALAILAMMQGIQERKEPKLRKSLEHVS